MANSGGFLNKMIKTEKTKILPLRWIGNVCGEIATNSLVKAFNLQGNISGYRFKFHCFIWENFNKPYTLWGTYYQIDIDKK